jgi:hypothetical protein
VHPYPEEKKSRTALRVPPGFQLPHQIKLIMEKIYDDKSNNGS